MLDKFKRFANIDNASVTPPPPSGECVFITITVTVPQDLTFILTPCGGEETPYTLNSDGTSTYSQCTASITYLPPNGGKYTLEVGDVCSF